METNRSPSAGDQAPHTTFDLSLGKTFRENWTVQASGLNLADNHYLLDNSNTFGGTHSSTRAK